jgi:hypothetical protein
MNNPNMPSTEHPQDMPQGKSALLRLVVVAAILLAAGLATVPFERGAAAPADDDHLIAPTVSMVAAPAAGTSVPPASEVFTGREVATEPAPPTF